jgi:hypothetical protein
MAAAAGNPNVITGLQIGAPTTNVVGLVDIGGGAPSDSAVILESYSSSAEFQVNLSQLNGELKVGLLDPIASGAGFDSLIFDIFENGSLVDANDFISEGAALAFFSDDVLDLGPIRNGGTGPLDLQFNFDLIASEPGAAFNTDFLIASVGNTVSATPEPACLLLLGSALFILGLRRRVLSRRN